MSRTRGGPGVVYIASGCENWYLMVKQPTIHTTELVCVAMGGVYLGGKVRTAVSPLS